MIALSTGSLYTYGLARIFELAAETEFDGIEVLIDNRPDTYHANYIRRLSKTYDLPVVALHSPFARVSGWPLDQLSQLHRTVALAQALAVPVVVMHLPFRVHDLVVQWNGFWSGRAQIFFPWPGRDPFYHFLLDGQLGKLETASGVTVAVENLPNRRFMGLPMSRFWFNRPEELIRFPHLTLDTTHTGASGWDVLEVYERLKGHIVHVHLSNFDGREHRPPPDGRLPLDELLRRLVGDRFAGAISIECGPDAFHADDEEQCREALIHVLAFCRQHFVDHKTMG